MIRLSWSGGGQPEISFDFYYCAFNILPVFPIDSRIRNERGTSRQIYS